MHGAPAQMSDRQDEARGVKVRVKVKVKGEAQAM
jgi:hypothetical protein